MQSFKEFMVEGFTSRKLKVRAHYHAIGGKSIPHVDDHVTVKTYGTAKVDPSQIKATQKHLNGAGKSSIKKLEVVR